MGKINCRGHENRVKLCECFEIKAEFRIKLLKGIVISDAGGRITDELYIFSAYDRQNGSFYDKITCGEATARDFLLITGERRPALFNMLKSTRNTTSKPEKKTSTPVTERKCKENLIVTSDTRDWHPVNRALYEAIMIMIIVWNDHNANGSSLLFRELYKCRRYPDKYPYSDRLLRINTIISKDKRRTLKKILQSLKDSGNDLRDFNLELLHEAVLKCGVKSNIL